MESIFLENRRDNQFVYLIGNNGSGKSTYLKDCATKYRDNFKKTVALPCGVFDRFSHKSTGNYVYLGYKSSANAVFLSAIDKQITCLIFNLIKNQRSTFLKHVLDDLGLDLKFESEKTMWDRRTHKDRRTTEADRGVADGYIKDYIKHDKWMAIPSEIAGLLERCVDRDLKFFARFKPTQTETYYSPSALSSGYLQKLKLLLSIAKEAEDDSLFLIDEPEISLHVKWQSELPSLLRMAFSNLQKCVIIVATHSPIIVSNSMADKDSVINIPDDERLDFRKADRNIENVLFNKFGYLPANNRIIPELCSDIIYKLTHNSLTPNECESILEEINNKELKQEDKNYIDKTRGIIQIVKTNKGA